VSAPKAGGNLEGLVGAARVDDRNLVDEGVALHELATEDHHFLADRLLFVESRDAEGDGEPRLLLGGDELPEIAKLAVVEGVGLEPGVKIHR
jgi:hypothetical protein